MEGNCRQYIPQYIESDDSCENTMKEVTKSKSVVSRSCKDLVSLTNTKVDVTLNDVEELTCYTCHEAFTEIYEYRLHVKQHGLQRFQCIQCCKIFPTHYRLKRHEQIHNDMSSYQCPYCSQNYRASYSLKRHIESSHTEGKSRICNVCNLRFSRVDVLKRHLQLHMDEKRFKCSTCSQSFKTNDYLDAHHKVHATRNSTNQKG